MALRRNQLPSDQQLDLFSTRRPNHETTDAIRPDGRETLARTLPEAGARTTGEGTAASDASGGGGEDQGRNGHAANGFDAPGINGPTSSRPGLGAGAGEIHPAPARDLGVGHHADGHRRHQEEPPKNLNNYRLTEVDRLGDGGPKQKFQQNLAAIRTLRKLAAESRAATEEEKANFVKYVGWGAMPQVFDEFNVQWREQ